MNTHENRVEALFNEAINYTPDQRTAFLNGACGHNAELRQKVDTLLKAHDEADQFLPEAPTLGDSADPIEQPGTVIGRYKLLQPIGEGGMGAVFMAEQTEPVRRKVALKIIKLGMDTKSVVARFEAERQALALMDHPNIAKVLDGGATESGRPFFVMELVKGVPINDYCDKNQLPTEDRLNLFTQVCQAIQHAHQKGVIHRDIKPSNILVTLHDGKPVPKVIDFGIAKATNQRLTEKTLFTNYAQMIGTPAYMSPEQAEMSGLDVDTRTDVYSLGVLLYELLTGTTPFPEKQLLSHGYGEIQRILAEEEPERPSLRLSTLQGEQQSIVSKNRSEPATDLTKRIRGDLDWIVMKALEKDRTRRYDTVNSLATDFQNHLTDQPILAAQPNFSYRLRKFYRRKKTLVDASIAIAACLVIGVTIATIQHLKANRAQRAAIRAQSEARKAHAAAFAASTAEQEQKAEAERNREIANRVNQFLTEEILGLGDGYFSANSDLTLRDAIDQAAVRIHERMPDPSLEKASLLLAFAKIYESRGYHGQRRAPRLTRDAYYIRSDILGPGHRETLKILASVETLSFRREIEKAYTDHLKNLKPHDEVRIGLSVQHCRHQMTASRLKEVSAEWINAETKKLVDAARQHLGLTHPTTYRAFDTRHKL